MLGGGVFISYFQEEFVKIQNKGFLENLEEFACKIEEDGYSICREDLKIFVQFV